MDFSKIMSQSDKYQKERVLVKEIEESLTDKEFKLSDVYRAWPRGGSIVVKELNSKFANQEYDRQFYFKVEVQQSHPKGIFLVALGDKQSVIDPVTSQRVSMTGELASVMRDRYKETGNLDDHYMRYAKLPIDENGCVKCSYPIATTLVIRHTNNFYRKNPNRIVKELSESEYLELNKKPRKSNKSE